MPDLFRSINLPRPVKPKGIQHLSARGVKLGYSEGVQTCITESQALWLLDLIASRVAKTLKNSRKNPAGANRAVVSVYAMKEFGYVQCVVEGVPRIAWSKRVAGSNLTDGTWDFIATWDGQTMYVSTPTEV